VSVESRGYYHSRYHSIASLLSCSTTIPPTQSHKLAKSPKLKKRLAEWNRHPTWIAKDYLIWGSGERHASYGFCGAIFDDEYCPDTLWSSKRGLMETDGDRFSARFLSDSFLSFPAFLRSPFSCLFASWSRLVFINSKNVDGVSTTSIYTLRNPYQGKPESYIILNPHTCRRREKEQRITKDGQTRLTSPLRFRLISSLPLIIQPSARAKRSSIQSLSLP